MTLKPSIRSSFSKIGSKNSLLGKLLMDYTWSITPPPLILSLGLLMLQTVVQELAATQYRQTLKYYSVANSSQSLVTADHLGVLVGQNRCTFLKMTEHN